MTENAQADQGANSTLNANSRRNSDLFSMARYFFKMEAAAGILLVIFAVIALIIANSPFYHYYDHFLHNIKFRIGFDDVKAGFDIELRKSLLHWINDGFMAVFFFLVGLEIKREMKEGELSSRTRALLPAVAAVGGMVVPALIYYLINMDSPENLRGWAIPTATDIAFALGVLGLLGSRVPIQLKILLTAVAVIDDLGAILVIAIFYSDQIYIKAFYFAAVALVVLAGLNVKNVTKTTPYVLLGIVLWIAVLKSGVHATLAGVIVALFIPMRDKNTGISPCKNLEHALHPWVSYGILPLFAFANAGVPFHNMGFHSFMDPVTLGIILGLVVGKQIGIFSTLWLAIKTGLSPKPDGVTWVQLYAVSILCGIGFTMSLFIGGLAFASIEQQASIRLGVLVGSLISAVFGYVLLRAASPHHIQKPSEKSA